MDSVMLGNARTTAASLELSIITDSFRRRHGISSDFSDQAEKLYRQFLHLKQIHPDRTLVGTVLIDEFWHTHLLHTRQYRADCEKLFAYYLDHEPGETPHHMQRFVETIDLFQS